MAFSDDDPDTNELYMKVFRAHPKLCISQTKDATVGHLAQLSAFEVKSPDSTYNAASIQLATWWAAGLEKMRQLARQPVETSEDDELLPFVGCTVVGHHWDLHIAFKKRNGQVVSLPSFPVHYEKCCPNNLLFDYYYHY